MEKWRRIIHSSSAPTRCAATFTRITFQKRNATRKKEKEEHDHVLKKMEIKWTRGGCLLLSKKNRPFWNTFLLLLLFFLLLLFAPRSLISFFCRPRQFIFTPASCSSWLLQSTMDPSESGRDERLAGHGQPQATAGHKLEE